jgi:hypothetical protein
MPRPISIVHVTPDFEKAYLRLPKHIQNLATRKDQWFRKDAFDPCLRTEPFQTVIKAKPKVEVPRFKSPFWTNSDSVNLLTS